MLSVLWETPSANYALQKSAEIMDMNIFSVILEVQLPRTEDTLDVAEAFWCRNTNKTQVTIIIL